MDLSNRESAAYWYRQATDEPDPDLRKEALKAYRKFLKMAEREEHIRLRQQKPGYGVRTMFGWIVAVSLFVLVVILWLGKSYSVAVVCSVFALAIVVCLVAAAVTLRVFGHLSERSMLVMIQDALKAVGLAKSNKSALELAPAASEELSSVHRQLAAGASEPESPEDGSN